MAFHGNILTAFACAALLAGRVHSGSIDPEASTDTFNPVASAYQVNEARRQDLIARQLDLNYRLIYSAGYGPSCPGPRELWPRVPGDFWGYPGSPPIEHPVGHESRQFGPDRWIYRPLYAADIEADPPANSPILRVPAKGSVEQLPGPSDPEPDTPLPAPRVKKIAPAGPREF